MKSSPTPTPQNEPWWSGTTLLLLLAGVVVIAAAVFFLASGASSPVVKTNPTPRPALLPRKAFGSAVRNQAESPMARVEKKALGTPEPARPMTAEEKESQRLLMERSWTWEYDGAKPRAIDFDGDGTVKQSRFSGTYALEGGLQVVVRKAGEEVPAVLTFKPDWSAYDGRDFGGTRRIWGVAKPRLETLRSLDRRPQGEREAGFTRVLTATAWTWERLGAPATAFRFGAGGGLSHPSFTGTWKLAEKGPIVIQQADGKKALFQLDDDLGGWQGTDFDGKSRVWGKALK